LVARPHENLATSGVERILAVAHVLHELVAHLARLAVDHPLDGRHAQPCDVAL
jgi:hypothetical protein